MRPCLSATAARQPTNHRQPLRQHQQSLSKCAGATPTPKPTCGEALQHEMRLCCPLPLTASLRCMLSSPTYSTGLCDFTLNQPSHNFIAACSPKPKAHQQEALLQLVHARGAPRYSTEWRGECVGKTSQSRGCCLQRLWCICCRTDTRRP